MFISAQEYLQRVSHALEHVVAPEIESEYVRGQVLAAVFLIDQLMDRIDYKPELIRQEIQSSCKTAQRVLSVLMERGVNPPNEVKEFLTEVERGSYELTVECRNRCADSLSVAIDLFHAHRNRLESAVDYEMEEVLLGHLSTVASRDMGLFKFSTSMKLLQKKGQPELR
jgi:hypothetical protein